MSGPGVQVWVYPEELDAVEPARLAEQVLELGCDTISLALAYHRARRVLPRQGRVSLSPGGAISFTPRPDRYGALVPRPTAPQPLRDAVEALREACAAAGLRFHAWLVALHSEPLALAHPDLAARTLDGAPTGFSLCPSSDEALEYVSALVADVCEQLEPDGVDLEAALYPAWEPAYTLTLALEPLSERAALYGSQCFCPGCRGLPGLAGLEEPARRAAGPPFGPGGELERPPDEGLARARAARVERLLAAVRDAAHAHEAELCPTASGAPESARLRGLAPASVAAADRVLLGLGRLSGRELEERLAGLRALVGDRAVTASLNWGPERPPGELAADAERAAAGGASSLALYNLSLVPEAGLDAFRAAAGAFRAAVAA
ncbi:MAG TPA: hypothetical protein VF186_10745 [Gaiellaceae bacterium]